VKPLRVLHLASGDLWAGAEQQLYFLMKALAAQPGISVEAVLLNSGVLADKLRAAGIQVAIIEESRFNTARILLAFIQILRTTRPDIVHTHRRKENIIGAIASAFYPGIRSLRTQHGAEEFPWSWRHPTQLVIGALDWIAALFLQTRVIAVSPELSSKLAGHLPKKKLVCIPNGVDCEELIDQANSLALPLKGYDNCKRIAFIGRLVPVKRVDLFLETAALIAKQRPSAFRFYVLGDGPLRQSVERMIDTLNLRGTLTLLGFQQPIAPFLRKMDAIAILSDHEGLPMTVLEAMSLGAVVVAHAVGGIPLALNDGECGILISDQDPRQYAEAIVRLFEDPLLSSDYVAKAKKRAKENFSSTICALRHIDVYTELRN
jgi:L-malate glycosyltransferase